MVKGKRSKKGRTTPPSACGSAWEARCIMMDQKGWKWNCNIFGRIRELQHQVCATATIDTSKKPAQIIFKDVD